MNPPPTLTRLFALALSLAGLLTGQLTAQPDDAPGLTSADVEARRKVWTSSATDPAVQKVVLPLADEAASRLEQAAQAEKQRQTFLERASALPAKAKELQNQAGKPVALPDNLRPPPPDTPVDALEVAATRLRTAVEQARQNVSDIRDLPQQQASRRKELTTSIADLSARLLKSRSATADGTDNPETAEARTMARTAGIAADQAQMDAAKAELAWLDASSAIGWPELALADANRALAALETADNALTSRIEQARAKKAATGLETATRNEATAPAELQPILQEVTRRAAENQNVVDHLIPEAEARLRGIEADVRKWQDLAQRTQEKIQRLGASGIMGVELRQQRQSLPSRAELGIRSNETRETLNGLELTRMALEEELAGLPAASPRPDGAEAAAWQSRREALTTLRQTYDRYYNTLIRQEEALQQLAAVTTAHREFIHEKILWIPSAVRAGRESASTLGASLRWLGEGLASPALFTAWWQGVQSAPVVAILWIAFLAFLFSVASVGRKRLIALGRLASQDDAAFPPTAAALLWTIVVALPWPALLWSIARPWHEALQAPHFALAWAASLESTALVLLGLECVRQPLRPGGLAEAHFQWPLPVVRQLRGQFRRLLAVVLPCLVCGLAFRHSDELRHDPAERGCLLLLLLAFSWWLHRFWSAGREHAGLPARGLKRLAWSGGHALSVLVPIALCGLALAGYLYTAEVLTERLALSLLAAAGFLLARLLFLRWYALHRRNLRAARARRLREARESARSAAATAAATSPDQPAAASGTELPVEPVTQITGPDIDETGQEMRGLLDIIAFIAAAAVAWAIWSDVLPAAKNLNSHSLENVAALLPTGGTTTAPATGTAAPDAPAAPLRTTFLDVLLAGAAGVLTIMAARRIPGALQFVLTSQITLDAGARFALSTVTRYVILIAGAVFTLNLIGITWSSVQWLAAALTVGLGFGLQEIFANFFSGLIILLERPIRPGDIVTIDGITGCVSRIQIRATTIRAADGKDYIVPNREFVTGKLLNWTRTDTATRQEIPVGVAYGTNPEAALALLASIAAAHPAVLKDPAPLVTFESFGDSSLNLVLRFHVGTVEQRLPTLTALNCAIAREFAAAGIEIPFPQRDIHLRTLPEKGTPTP